MTELIDSKHVDMHCYFILRQYLPPHLHQGTHWVVSTSIPTFTSALVWFNLLRCKRGFCKIRLYLLSFETIVIFHLNIPMIHDNTELSMSNSYTNIYTYIRPSLPPSLNYLSMPPPITPDRGVHFGFPVLNVGFWRRKHSIESSASLQVFSVFSSADVMSGDKVLVFIYRSKKNKLFRNN